MGGKGNRKLNISIWVASLLGGTAKDALLRKIFDLRKIFAVPKDFLKSKISCTNKDQVLVGEQEFESCILWQPSF